jgi:signal transduction histidine kinase
MMIADRIVSLGLLAAGLSHHIRNSLVAVKTFLDLAPNKLQEENLDLAGLRNPDFWKDYYQNVQGQIAKINNMLKDLWVASETPAFSFKDQVNLREVVEGVLEKMKDAFGAKNIRVENGIPASLPPLNVEAPKFQRLFELLFKDEIVSLPPGSQITLSAEMASESPAGKAEIHLQIKDNGPGLPKEALRLIFDPFVVRADSPMEYGINLMACYFIVHHHAGRIEAKSEDGHGTTFNLHLPLNPNHGPPAEQNQEFLRKVLLNDTLWEKLLTAA